MRTHTHICVCVLYSSFHFFSFVIFDVHLRAHTLAQTHLIRPKKKKIKQHFWSVDVFFSFPWDKKKSNRRIVEIAMAHRSISSSSHYYSTLYTFSSWRINFIHLIFGHFISLFLVHSSFLLSSHFLKSLPLSPPPSSLSSLSLCRGSRNLFALCYQICIPFRSVCVRCCVFLSVFFFLVFHLNEFSNGAYCF